MNLRHHIDIRSCGFALFMPIDMPAACPMTGCDFAQWRVVGSAMLIALKTPTTRVKRATAGQVRRIGDIAFNRSQAMFG